MKAKRRNLGRPVKILLFPLLALAFLIGWCMQFAGKQERAVTAERKQPREDGVTFMPMVPEEPQEIIIEQ